MQDPKSNSRPHPDQEVGLQGYSCFSQSFSKQPVHSMDRSLQVLCFTFSQLPWPSLRRSIDKIAQRTKGGGTNHFDQQQKGEAQCLSKHIEAIDISIGAEEVTADHFTIPGAAGSQEQILQELRRLKLMKGPRFSKKLLVGSQVLKSVMQAQKCIESTKSKAQHKRRCEQDRDVIKILESKVSVCDQLLGLLAQDAQAAVLAPSNLWNRDCVPHLQEEDYRPVLFRYCTSCLFNKTVRMQWKVSEETNWETHRKGIRYCT